MKPPHSPCTGRPSAKRAQPFAEPGGGREPAGVQLGIAARQPADVAAEVRRLVGQRREGQELGARRAPGPCDVRIDEAEGGVLGNGDALAGRRQRGRLGAASAGQRAGEPEDRVEIERPLDRIRGPARSRLRVPHARRPAPARGAAPAAPSPDRGRARRPPAGRAAPAPRAPSARAARSRPGSGSRPPMRTAGSCAAKPRATAAAVCDWPETSRIRSTGAP